MGPPYCLPTIHPILQNSLYSIPILHSICSLIPHFSLPLSDIFSPLHCTQMVIPPSPNKNCSHTITLSTSNTCYSDINGNVWCCMHQNSWHMMYGHIRNLVQWFTETHGSLGTLGHMVHWFTETDGSLVHWDTWFIWFGGSFGSLGHMVHLVHWDTWFIWFTGTHGSFGSVVQWDRWFILFSGTHGSFSSVVHWDSWFIWFGGSRDRWFIWFTGTDCSFGSLGYMVQWFTVTLGIFSNIYIYIYIYSIGKRLKAHRKLQLVYTVKNFIKIANISA